MKTIFKQNLRKKKKYDVTMVNSMNKLDFYTMVHKNMYPWLFFKS